MTKKTAEKSREERNSWEHAQEEYERRLLDHDPKALPEDKKSFISILEDATDIVRAREAAALPEKGVAIGDYRRQALDDYYEVNEILETSYAKYRWQGAVGFDSHAYFRARAAFQRDLNCGCPEASSTASDAEFLETAEDRIAADGFDTPSCSALRAREESLDFRLRDLYEPLGQTRKDPVVEPRIGAQINQFVGGSYPTRFGVPVGVEIGLLDGQQLLIETGAQPYVEVGYQYDMIGVDFYAGAGWSFAEQLPKVFLKARVAPVFQPFRNIKEDPDWLRNAAFYPSVEAEVRLKYGLTVNAGYSFQHDAPYVGLGFTRDFFE